MFRLRWAVLTVVILAMDIDRSWIRIALVGLVLWAAPAAADVSYTQERELGKRFDLMARQRFPLVSDPEIISYVEDIGKKITGRLEDSFFDYHFAVVKDASINAFAVPWGVHLRQPRPT